MFPELTGGPLNIISSAVTPAVMISASAILIGGVSAKHSAMSDRLRALTSEYREPGTTETRRANIEKQCTLFLRRIQIVSLSHVLLYAATAVFSLMVLVISVSSLHAILAEVLFPLFLVGVLMILISAVSEIVELQIARRALGLEVEEIHFTK